MAAAARTGAGRHHGTSAEPSSRTSRTKSDVDELRRADRARDRAYKLGEQHGRDSKLHERKAPESEFPDGEHDDLYRQGYEAGRGEQMRGRVGDAGKSVGGGALNIAHESSGFLLGLLAYAIVLNFVRGGKSGVLAWFNAKFRNKVAAAPAPPSSGALPLGPLHRGADGILRNAQGQMIQ